MSNTRRDFLKTLGGAGVAASIGQPRFNLEAQAAVGATRPNILLLFPDQWRFDWESTNGQLPIRTPNIDRIASRGVRFKRAIVASPVCAPSRACLASGKEYERAGVPSNDWDYPGAEKTMYSKLRKAGYHTMGCGKMDLAKAANWWGPDGQWKVATWGFSAGINSAGKWDQVRGMSFNNGKPADPYTTFLDRRGLLAEHIEDYRKRALQDYQYPFPTPLPDDAYGDNWITANCLRLLNDAPKDAPWFMQVNWTGPHDPEDITERMTKTVRGLKMPPVIGGDEFDEKTNQMIRQNYTAMCENIDRGIGQILDAVEAAGQLSNTIVIFSSDHGEMLGDLGRWAKSVPFQASAAVPLVVAGPGIRKAATSDALVSSIDIHATILDLAGLDQQNIDGRSVRAVLHDGVDQHRRVIYSGLGGWRMVFDGRYKVITGFALGKGASNGDNLNKWDPKVMARTPLCYDLREDPGELHNLASLPGPARSLLTDLQSATYPA